jgi:hypothetical protein
MMVHTLRLDLTVVPLAKGDLRPKSLRIYLLRSMRISRKRGRRAVRYLQIGPAFWGWWDASASLLRCWGQMYRLHHQVYCLPPPVLQQYRVAQEECLPLRCLSW